MQKPLKSTTKSNNGTALSVPDDALAQMPAIMWTTDVDLRFTSSQGAVLPELNLEQNEVVGTTLYEFMGTTDPHHLVIDAHRRALAGESVCYEDSYAKRDFDVTVSPLRESDGKIVGCIGISFDITARRQRERAVRETEQNLLSLTGGSPDYILQIDANGLIHDINRTLPQLSAADVVGTRIYDWLDKEFHERISQNVEACFERGEVRRDEHSIENPDGTTIWFDVRLGPITLDDETVGAVLMCFDITRQKEAEQSLRGSEERFRMLAENIPGVVYLCRNDKTFSMLYLNDAVEEMTGYPKEDFLEGRVSFVDLFHPDDADEITRIVDEAVSRQEPYQLTYRIKHQQGGWRWIEERGIGFQDGGSTLLEGHLSDITEKKQAEKKLHRDYEAVKRDLLASETQLQSIVDNTTAVVFMKDLEGRYLLVNRHFLDLFHFELEGVVGKTDADIFPPEMAQAFRENDRDVVRVGHPVEYDEIAPHDDGPHNYISIKLPLRNPAGEIYAICGIATDITDRIRAENNIKEERTALRKMLAMQEQERRLITYEIHDGLIQNIVGAKMMIERACDAVPSETNDQADRLRAARRLLAGAIDEGRRLISELRPMILDEQGLIGSISYLVEDKPDPALDVRFEHRVQFTRLPALLEGTMYRIVQEALNNARRHSQATVINVRLTQAGNSVRLEINDNGRGFDPDTVPSDRFGVRGMIERAKLFGGSGTVESTLGRGTRIVVELPVASLDDDDDDDDDDETT